MLTKIASNHYHVPDVGDIVYIVGRYDRCGRACFPGGRPKRYIVESYPLTNERGITMVHCANVRPLGSGPTETVAWQYLIAERRVYRTHGGYYKVESEW